MTKFRKNLFRHRILALFYIANIRFYLDSLYDSTIPLVISLLDTCYKVRIILQKKFEESRTDFSWALHGNTTVL